MKKMKTRIMVIANQKGGVGKSTTAVNLSAVLADKGKKVLLIDMDPQGNATSGLGIARKNGNRCVYDVLVDNIPMKNIIQETGIEHLFVAPATIQLAGAEIELVSALSRETKLKRSLDTIDGEFDFIIIDCPPSLGLLTLNALTAGLELIIPIQCEYYALEGLSKLMDTVRLVNVNLNSDLKITGVLLTMHDGRTKLSEQVVNDVRSFFNETAFKTVVPRNVRLSEAPSFGQPISIYDPSSKGAEAYRNLAKEVIERG
jgi:chromosome partitioning protein